MTQATHKTDADLEAIEVLHHRDMAAAKSGDAETLRSLWTEDIVVMPPEGKVVRGKAANYAALLGQLETLKDTVITEYVLDFEEVRIEGDFAFEWGCYRGASRPAAGGEEKRSNGKIMRVLARSQDGSWKVARSIWTAGSAEE